MVDNMDNSFVVHLLEPAMKRCFTGDLCILGSNIGELIIRQLNSNKLHERIMGTDNVFK